MRASAHRSFIAIPNSPSRRKAWVRIGGERFARKFGFGERRRDANAVTAKIFLLPKFATQSPCTRLFDGIAESQWHRSRTDRQLREFKKVLWRSRFLHYWQAPMSVVAALFASARALVVVPSNEVLRARSHCLVNTSLSGTLFFWMRWCIRDVVHLDSRVHAAIKPSHLHQEGNMAKKAKKAKKAKSAVKKTAKKTRKVAKKKK
jgi:hypothetical protein